jgi:hypothetical protein
MSASRLTNLPTIIAGKAIFAATTALLDPISGTIAAIYVPLMQYDERLWMFQQNLLPADWRLRGIVSREGDEDEPKIESKAKCLFCQQANSDKNQ